MTWNDLQILFIGILFCVIATSNLINLNRRRDRFHNVPVYVRGIAFGGLLVSWITVFFIPLFPVSLLWLALAYFVCITGYAAVVLLRTAHATAGVAAWRLQFSAAGALLTGLTILLPTLAHLVPTWFRSPGDIPLFLAFLAGASYYLAFAPPHWLRRIWQQSEFHRFLSEVTVRPGDQPAADALVLLSETTTRLMGGARVVLARLDETKAHLVINQEDVSGVLPLDQGLIDRVWKEGRPMIAPSLAVLGHPSAKLFRGLGARSTMVIPLATREEPLGLMFVFLKAAPLFADDHLELLKLLAEQSAINHSYTTLIASERTTRQHAETLLHTASHLNRHLELDKALQVMCRETARVLDVPIVIVSLFDEQRQELYLATAHGLPAAVSRHLRPIPRRYLRNFEHGAMTIHDDVQTVTDLPDLGPLRRANFRTLIHAPILDNGRFLGRLTIITVNETHTFTTEELTLLQGIASQASLAIQNARLFRQVHRHATELEHRVTERTLDLEKRNNELDAFAHTVAHDLKNPISNIVSSVDLITAAPAGLDDEGQLCLDYIRQSAQKMQHIINELLLLSRVRDAEVKLETVEMDKIAAEAQQRLYFLIKEHGATIHLPADWPAVRGYGPWLEEVWVNYLSNGIKYGGRPPYLVLGATEELDGMIRFWIHDNGPGIPAVDRRRLFKPHTKLDQLPKQEGDGLGLSIVQRIITRLGGEVGVDSEPGQGSTFWFSLPEVAPVTRYHTYPQSVPHHVKVAEQALHW